MEAVIMEFEVSESEPEKPAVRYANVVIKESEEPKVVQVTVLVTKSKGPKFRLGYFETKEATWP